MKRACTLALLLAALPVAAEVSNSRLRIENAGKEGRVVVVMTDTSVRTVEITMAGGAAGEVMTVEAKVPDVLLGGGTLEGDRLLEAVVEQKVNAASGARPTVTVLPAPPSFRVEGRRYVNDVFTDTAFAYWPVYPNRTYTYRGSGRTCQARPVRSTRPAVRPVRASTSMRAAMPRR